MTLLDAVLGRLSLQITCSTYMYMQLLDYTEPPVQQGKEARDECCLLDLQGALRMPRTENTAIFKQWEMKGLNSPCQP